MANYIATLGARGVHHRASVIKAIQGQGNTLKSKPEIIKVDDKKYYEYIIQGKKSKAEDKKQDAKDKSKDDKEGSTESENQETKTVSTMDIEKYISASDSAGLDLKPMWSFNETECALFYGKDKNQDIILIGANIQDGLDISKSCAEMEERRVGKECRSRWSPYH